MLTSLLSSCWRFFPRLCADRSGSIAIFVAIGAVPLVLAVGVAVDYSNAGRVRAQMTSAADAAALAAVARGATHYAMAGQNPQQVTHSTQIAHAAFQANLEASPTTNGVVLLPRVTSNQRRVRAEVCFEAAVRTHVMTVVGYGSIPIRNCVTAASEPPRFVEINVLMDASGSMGIGATRADQLRMEATIGCAFGCHVNDSDRAARLAGATLRFDVIRNAVAGIVQQADSDATLRQQVRFNIYKFSNVMTQIADSRDPLHRIRQAVLGTEMDGMAQGAGTDFRSAIRDFAAAMPVSGDGTSAASPVRFLLIMTDGIENSVLLAGTNTHWWVTQDPDFVPFPPVVVYNNQNMQGFNPTYCTAVKAKGATVMTLNTPYLVPPGTTEPRFTQIRDILQPHITANMQSCASRPELAFSASDPDDIEAAVNQMFSLTHGVPRLTN
jgi:Flp pilus assembly protein TadG